MKKCTECKDMGSLKSEITFSEFNISQKLIWKAYLWILDLYTIWLNEVKLIIKIIKA